ncbi:hypothetical protein Vadar_029437 [Vaccinium darrowii]|uniref:Uncharacterized protein n=1 Tax=Vaccinium darrowii TaxID=229202 RepID=A0ACB7Y3W8_9ERIC|nr:hypothetical protein Vadar_029437 [Vaccinium darrowii]
MNFSSWLFGDKDGNGSSSGQFPVGSITQLLKQGVYPETNDADLNFGNYQGEGTNLGYDQPYGNLGSNFKYPCFNQGSSSWVEPTLNPYKNHNYCSRGGKYNNRNTDLVSSTLVPPPDNPHPNQEYGGWGCHERYTVPGTSSWVPPTSVPQPYEGYRTWGGPSEFTWGNTGTSSLAPMSSQHPPSFSSTNWDSEDDDMFEDCEEEGMIENLVTVAMLREVEQNLHPEKRPFHTSPLTGKAYMEDLKKGHPRRFFRYNNPKIQERFQHSGETVSRHLHKILECMVKFVDDKIKPTRRQDDTHPYLDTREMANALEPLTAPMSCANVVRSIKKTFFSRKGYTTQNIIVACDFNLTFVFASAGYDGSLHNYTIFRRTACNNDCPFPRPEEGKFYLVDAGYPNMKGYLAPFKGYKDHQADFRRGKRRISCEQEYFNWAHSSLRSIIERTFGIWKAWWGTLKNMPNSEPNYVFEDIADLYPGMLDDDKDANPQPQDEDFDFYMAKVRHDIVEALHKNRKR